MESRARVLGHPLHQTLIVLPAGLLMTASVFDFITWLRHDPRYTEMAAYLIAAGLITGLLAAVFGIIDWLKIPAGTRAGRVGALHGAGNLVVMGLYAMSWLIRFNDESAPGLTAYVLSYAGFALLLVTGYLGGEMVVRHRIGISDIADYNAPPSWKTDPLTGPRPDEETSSARIRPRPGLS